MRAEFHWRDVPLGWTRAWVTFCGCFTNVAANRLLINCIKIQFTQNQHWPQRSVKRCWEKLLLHCIFLDLFSCRGGIIQMSVLIASLMLRQLPAKSAWFWGCQMFMVWCWFRACWGLRSSADSSIFSTGPWVTWGQAQNKEKMGEKQQTIQSYHELTFTFSSQAKLPNTNVSARPVLL